MKIEIFYFALLLAIVASENSIDWNTFKTTYGKSYPDLATELKRKEIWEKNVKFIENHNREADLGKHTYRVSINKFADLTSEEFAGLYKKDFNRNWRKNIRRLSDKRLADAKLSDIPTSVDWRDKGCVSPVRDQGIVCNDLWAFGTTETIAGILCARNGSYVPLSVQQLFDCSTSFGNFGCQGGYVSQSFLYINYTGGIESDAAYPYEAQQGNCRFNIDKVVAKINGYKQVSSGNEVELTNVLANLGPVSAYIDASRTSFQLYSSGIYYDPGCSSITLDHLVLLVGYGSQGSNLDYYIAKNSWGVEWGEKGYILMSRNKKNNCGVATLNLYPSFP